VVHERGFICTGFRWLRNSMQYPLQRSAAILPGLTKYTMLTARITASFACFVCIASVSTAQIVHTSFSPRRAAVRPALKSGGEHTLALPFAVLPLTGNTSQTSTDTEITFETLIQNPSDTVLPITFIRTQTLPPGWQTSVCWGINCFAATDNSETYDIPPHGNGQLSLNFNPALSDFSDSLTTYLEVADSLNPSDAVMLPFRVNFVPANPPLVFSWTSPPRTDSVFIGSGLHVISNFFQSGLGVSNTYTFKTYDSLPNSGWSVTTCVGNSNCTQSDNLKVVFPPFGDNKIKFSVNAPDLSAPDSAIVYLSIHPTTKNTADSAVYRFSFVVLPSSSVASQSGESAGLVVTNAWPNPLRPSIGLHLEVLTDEPGTAMATVYNVDGTRKATLQLGELTAGTNDLQLSLPDELSSGEYIIRVTEGRNASEIVRINYIK
ncbi:MAG TPA: hypothetical protein VGM92_05570, partial [Candidatus Kapabacteria bacterium]